MIISINKRKPWPTTLLVIILFSVLGSCNHHEEQKLLIATAANAHFALEEIADNFAVETGIPTKIVIGSSGKHTAQIEAGAPYDIFVSADLRYPERLFTAGLTTSAPGIYAYGNLVLYSNKILTNQSLKKLLQESSNRIAIANPETAPYGMAAKEVLINLQLWDTLEQELVYGENVAQATQFVRTGAADLGFTASSLLDQSVDGGSVKHFIYVDTNLYSPIAQGVVIMKESTNPELAKKFYQYLFSAKGKEIMDKYGYRVADP